MSIRDPLDVRLARTVFKTSCGCHIWTGATFSNGYGAIGHKGRTRRVHRVVYELAHNTTLTSDQILLHSCDNPLCCNPQHLTVGTNKQNTHDCLAKGRYRNKWGQPKRHVDATLIADVLSAIGAGERCCDIAARLGIGRPMVSRIKHGRRTAT